jgi:hypothetical protein
MSVMCHASWGDGTLLQTKPGVVILNEVKNHFPYRFA